MRALFLGFGLVLVASVSNATAIFRGLGILPGGPPGSFSFASAVSADGSVVVGHSYGQQGLEAVRWTRSGGMETLGIGGGEPHAVSADGSTIVGTGPTALSVSEAWVWTASGGRLNLGDLAGGIFSSGATGVSADGSIVVGAGRSASGGEAFVWTAAGGMVGLGDLPGGIFESSAFGVSADGSTVVGNSVSALGREASVWTRESGMVGLGDLPGGSFTSSARAISADGSTVVGWGTSSASSPSFHEAMRWTNAGGMVGLGDLPGGFFRSEALAVSADGSIVVGSGSIEDTDPDGPGSQSVAFIWDEANGMRSLEEVLASEFGLDLGGWRLGAANGISVVGDVVTIIGNGVNPNGVGEAWIAVLPEPSLAWLLALGLAGLSRSRRRIP